MNDQERILKIRRLLDRFYDGKATPEETEVLSELFAAGNLPADLEAERKVFEMMAEPDTDGVEIPAGLEDSLMEIMAEPRPSFMARFRPWAIGGAAAAVILALITVIKSPSDNEPFSVGEATATVDKPADTARCDTVVVHSMPIPDVEPAPLVAEQVRRSPSPAKAAPEPADPYTEITDPDEAARIAADLLCMVSEKMRSSLDKTEEVATSQITSVQTILSKLQ